MSSNKNSDPRYKPNNMFPDCHNYVGGGWYCSELCVCYMSDGSLSLRRWFQNENYSSLDKWQKIDGENNSVECWMEC